MPKSFKNPRNILISMILCILLLVPALFSADVRLCDPFTDRQPFQLLLNSGLTDSHHALVKYTVWTQEEDELARLEKVLQQTGGPWQKRVLRNYFQEKAYEYQCWQEISGSGEQEALERYRHLRNELKPLKASVYLEETVESEIDVRQFLQINKAKHAQTTLADPIISISGFSAKLEKALDLNGCPINFQIAVRSGDSVAKRTVLALPALLQEF